MILKLVLLFLTASTTSFHVSSGFVIPPALASSPQAKQQQQLPTTATATTTTALSAVGLEDLIYNAQSAASNLASISLQQASFSSLPIMYGAGLLASVSPCVWGLLPLTMSYISTAAGERDDKQATIPTLVFASGLAAVFCTLGLIAASVGGLFGQQDGIPFVSLLSSGLCLAMGLQLLEFVELPLPSFEFDVSMGDENSDGDDDEIMSSELAFDDDGNMLPPPPPVPKKKKQNNNAGSLVRTFLLGGSSALIYCPCATPVLTSILGFVANSHDPLLGAVLLLGYTFGYSTPLLLVASTGGQFLVNSDYDKVASWITPMTGGILLWTGTNGLLTAVFGDPSMVALAPILE